MPQSRSTAFPGYQKKERWGTNNGKTYETIDAQSRTSTEELLTSNAVEHLDFNGLKGDLHPGFRERHSWLHLLRNLRLGQVNRFDHISLLQGLWFLFRRSRLSSSSWAAVWNHEYAIQSKRICTTTFFVITVKGHVILVIVHYALKSVFKITVKLRG